MSHQYSSGFIKQYVQKDSKDTASANAPPEKWADKAPPDAYQFTGSLQAPAQPRAAAKGAKAKNSQNEKTKARGAAGAVPSKSQAAELTQKAAPIPRTSAPDEDKVPRKRQQNKTKKTQPMDPYNDFYGAPSFEMQHQGVLISSSAAPFEQSYQHHHHQQQQSRHENELQHENVHYNQHHHLHHLMKVVCFNEVVTEPPRRKLDYMSSDEKKQQQNDQDDDGGNQYIYAASKYFQAPNPKEIPLPSFIDSI